MWAGARPTPVAPPVITATLPSSNPAMTGLLQSIRVCSGAMSRHLQRSLALGLSRCRNSAVRVEVEVNSQFIRQSSLDLSGHVVGEHLLAASFNCTQHLPNYLCGLDLWKSELTRHIGVDRTDVQTQHLCTLLAQTGP